MRRDRADRIGQQAVEWLLARPERLMAMVASSGVAPGALQGLVDDPGFPGFALDFVLGSDADVLDFAASAGLRPEEPAMARAVLAGPLAGDWS
jgi:Protein of unknown function (DUF3572)